MGNEVIVDMDLVKVPMDDIFVDWDFNCRGRVSATDPKTLALAADIEDNTLQNALIVCKSEDATKAGKAYHLVAGHRRITALRIIGADIVPCIVKNYTKAEMLFTNLTENVQREALNISQEAKGIKSLRDEGMSLQQIAGRIGMSFGWVQVRDMMSKLPTDIQEVVVSNKFTTNQIRDLYTLRNDTSEQYELVRMIKDTGGKRVPVHQVSKTKPKSKKRIRTAAEIHEVQERIYDLIGNNIINVSLGWAVGEVDDNGFHEAVGKELEIWDVKYEAPEFT